MGIVRGSRFGRSSSSLASLHRQGMTLHSHYAHYTTWINTAFVALYSHYCSVNNASQSLHRLSTHVRHTWTAACMYRHVGREETRIRTPRSDHCANIVIMPQQTTMLPRYIYMWGAHAFPAAVELERSLYFLFIGMANT